MTCQDFLDDIDLSALQSLEEGEDARLRAHAAGCDPCRAQLLAAEAMVARLGLSVPVARAPRAMKRAVMDAVRSSAGHPPAAAQRRPAGRLTFRHSRWLIYGGMAAAVLLAPLAGLLYWNARLQREVNDLKTLQQQVADLRQDALQIQRQSDGLLLFSVPSAIKADFRPVVESIAARGAATWSPDRNKCYVRFDSLPPPPAGDTYRLWYVVDNNRIVDAGVVNPDGSGRADTTIDTSRWRGQAYEMVLRLEQRPSDAEAQALLTAILNRPQ